MVVNLSRVEKTGAIKEAASSLLYLLRIRWKGICGPNGPDVFLLIIGSVERGTNPLSRRNELDPQFSFSCDDARVDNSHFYLFAQQDHHKGNPQTLYFHPSQ
jgi:hypothetical protein